MVSNTVQIPVGILYCPSTTLLMEILMLILQNDFKRHSLLAMP